ncbi:hypothetical protein BDV10DRAFT_180201 [Aspergillus recurvatus]
MVHRGQTWAEVVASLTRISTAIKISVAEILILDESSFKAKFLAISGAYAGYLWDCIWKAMRARHVPDNVYKYVAVFFKNFSVELKNSALQPQQRILERYLRNSLAFVHLNGRQISFEIALLAVKIYTLRNKASQRSEATDDRRDDTITQNDNCQFPRLVQLSTGTSRRGACGSALG